jgi:Zn-dependent protease
MEQAPPPPPAPPVYQTPEPPPVVASRPQPAPLAHPKWAAAKKILGPLAVVLILLAKWAGKLKFIVAPVLKFFPLLLKTGGTMALSIGAYAVMYGWKFGLGLVLLIFVHECGHLVAARMLGLPAGAPVFIPFLGAFIALKEAPKNAWIESQVGIGGPLLGTAGAVVCYGLYMATGNELYRALTFVGFLLNLFNLAPIGFLDGGRIATALSPWLWIVGTVVMIALLVTSFNPLIFILLLLSLPRLISLFRKRTDEEKRFYEVTPGQRAFMATLYFGLIAALAVGMKVIHDAQMASGTRPF